MIVDKVKYTYGDLCIVPDKYTMIKSRRECFPFHGSMLPIFAAPMSSVVDDKNYNKFEENSINVVIPRTVPIETRLELAVKDNIGRFVAMSMDEFNSFIDGKFPLQENIKYHICIDVANGHMYEIYNLARKAKAKYGDMISIMTGNIANPETYGWIAHNNEYGGKRIIDFIRCGIGTGEGCITSSNTGVHYPPASLIDECRNIRKNKYGINAPDIIADGGIRNYKDIAVALALGADYVMIGGLLSQMVESAGDKCWEDNSGRYKIYMRMTAEDFNIRFPNGIKREHSTWSGKNLQGQTEWLNCLTVRFYGMASEEGSVKMGIKAGSKTPEGVVKELPVIGNIETFANNVMNYLRSAMSYCGARRLNEFIGEVKLVPMSVRSMNAINKSNI